MPPGKSPELCRPGRVQSYAAQEESRAMPPGKSPELCRPGRGDLMLLRSHCLLAVVVTWVGEGTSGVSENIKGHMKGCKGHNAIQ